MVGANGTPKQTGIQTFFKPKRRRGRPKKAKASEDLDEKFRDKRKKANSSRGEDEGASGSHKRKEAPSKGSSVPPPAKKARTNWSENKEFIKAVNDWFNKGPCEVKYPRIRMLWAKLHCLQISLHL